MRSNRRICGLPRSLGTYKLAVWGSCFVPGEPPLANFLANWATERNRSKLGYEKYQKRLENIADNAGGQSTVAWVTPQASLTKTQQKNARLYRFLLRAHIGWDRAGDRRSPAPPASLLAVIWALRLQVVHYSTKYLSELPAQALSSDSRRNLGGDTQSPTPTCAEN